MGGSGGSRWLGPTDPNILRRRIREAEETARNTTVDLEVDAVIGETLAQYNDRDHQTIKTILDRVLDQLGEEFEMPVDLRFGGSVSKNTYVNGLSDVDALVLIHSQEAKGHTPGEIRSIFADQLRSRFGREAVREGHVAVTVSVDGHEVQLLPAVRERNGYKIANSSGERWSSIRPRVFANQLVRSNQLMNGKLVPTIKLAKGIIGKLPEQRQLSGYHTEVLAVSIFKDYAGPKTPKAMLRHFFDKLPEAVRTPRRDVTGQSVYLDDYLGARQSPQRRIVADAMDRIARSLRNADGAGSVSAWRELLRTE
jgi:hypothetical protein